MISKYIFNDFNLCHRRKIIGENFEALLCKRIVKKYDISILLFKALTYMSGNKVILSCENRVIFRVEYFFIDL